MWSRNSAPSNKKNQPKRLVFLRLDIGSLFLGELGREVGQNEGAVSAQRHGVAGDGDNQVALHGVVQNGPDRAQGALPLFDVHVDALAGGNFVGREGYGDGFSAEEVAHFAFPGADGSVSYAHHSGILISVVLVLAAAYRQDADKGDGKNR